MKEPTSYRAAQEELQEILSQLQSQDVEIDALGELVARAKELITWSRARLRATDEHVEGLLGELS